MNKNRPNYSIPQRVFIYDSYIRTESARTVRRIFEEKFSGVRVPGLTSIHNLVNKFRETGSVQDKKRKRRRTVLTEETLDDIGHWLENSPQKSLRHLSQQTGISYTSIREATKLLKLKGMKLNQDMTETGNETLLEADQWKSEAAGVIQDIQEHVNCVEVSEVIQSSNRFIYLNLTTVEGSEYCVELSANGFRIVGNAYNVRDAPSERYYETPYALLSHISRAYTSSFGNSLLKKLENIKPPDSDGESTM